MARKLTVANVVVSIAVSAGIALAAGPRGTVAEAKALLAKAVEHYKSAGRTKALSDFNGGKPPWRDRDLYVVCIASDATIAANGAFPHYAGMPVDVLKDAEGKPLGRTMLRVFSSGKGEGAVHYQMINPVSKKMEPKTMYGEKVGSDVCGVGVYGGG